MKNFHFESISLLSRRERKARSVKFHPGRNLILGANHTGKSSLIRALFETLGAIPQGRLEDWDPNAVSLVRFRVNDTSYIAVRQRQNRALFSAAGELICATSSGAAWTTEFSRVTGFNLTFSGKTAETDLADPACFFLLFYINQDGSWQSGWNTFRGMQRYSSPWSAILEYFTGICPPEFYSVKAERDRQSAFLDELQREDQLLERARQRFSKSMAATLPKIEPTNFTDEVARLTKEVNVLNRQQEAMRERVVKEHEVLSSLRQQILVANEALRGHDRDSEVLQVSDQALVCPTCKAEHPRSFLDLLTYTEDARLVREIVAQLRDDEHRISERYARTQAALRDLSKTYTKVSEVLNTRRGDLRFRDVVESMGAEGALAAFEVEAKALKKRIDELTLLFAELERKLKELRNPRKAKLLLAQFRERYASARQSLNLPSVDVSRVRLTSRPDLSGSGGPRSVLAYYAAIWQVCHSASAEFSVPAVIDSPNQQAQDSINLPAVIKFIAKDLPAEMQLIVGLESSPDYSFDSEVRLEKPYGLLRDDEWESVEAQVEPYFRRMLDSLAFEANKLI